VFVFGLGGVGAAPPPQNPKPQIPNPQSPIPNFKKYLKIKNKNINYIIPQLE